MKKSRQAILAIFALLAIALTFCSCGSNDSGSEKENEISVIREDTTEIETESPDILRTEIGTGERMFIFEVTKSDGTLKSFQINTDKAYVGEALEEYSLIKGDEGEYGLYVKIIDGERADYDENKAYWAFYVDGALSNNSVDKTEITDGSVYSFVYTK